MQCELVVVVCKVYVRLVCVYSSFMWPRGLQDSATQTTVPHKHKPLLHLTLIATVISTTLPLLM